jgi:hypothetical protein
MMNSLLLPPPPLGAGAAASIFGSALIFGFAFKSLRSRCWIVPSLCHYREKVSRSNGRKEGRTSGISLFLDGFVVDAVCKRRGVIDALASITPPGIDP